MTVFDIFNEIEYGYVILDRGTVFGNVVATENGEPKTRTLKGVFKFRQGFNIDGRNMEAFGGEMATLHAHPEDFDSTDVIVGNGVVVNGVEYEIKGITYGTNFDTGEVEHIRLSLKEMEYAS